MDKCRKFANPSMPEILVVTLAYAHPYRLWGRGRGDPRQPEEGWRMPSFLGGNSHGAFGHGRFSWREIACPPSLLKKVFKKARLAKRFSSIELEFKNLRKIANVYKWKEKVKKNTQLSFWWKHTQKNCRLTHLLSPGQTESQVNPS